MTKHFRAILVATAVLNVGTAQAQSQKPSQGTKETQHHQMMQGLTDAMFVPMMMKHHQQGIDMACLEEQGGSSASVKALAAKIRQSQEKELAELKAHAEHAGAKGTSGQAEHDRMMEEQRQTMMSRLKSASGTARDHAFLDEMAKHHEGAISMTEGAKLQDPELKRLAQKMVAGQRQELAELKKELAAHK